MRVIKGYDILPEEEHPHILWCPNCHLESGFDPGVEATGKLGQVRETLLVKCYHCGRLTVPVHFRDTHDEE